jgi:hypothetical protein
MKQYFLLLLIIQLFTFNLSYAQRVDSLYTKRVFLATYVYKDSIKLSKKQIVSLYKDMGQPKIKYKWSNILKPIAPLVTLGGVGLAALALKGADATAIVDGKNVAYKVRSLPNLLIGLGLVFGGLSMIESSNELVQHSVDIYNSILKPEQKTGYINNIKFGITQSNAVGFTISLK